MRIRDPGATIPGMPHVLPSLPYAYDALAPTIDELTMRMHHGKHHDAYVASLNGALAGTRWADRPVDDLLAGLDELPGPLRAVVREAGGAHANHSLLWESMTPSGGGDPNGRLDLAIADAFGSVGELRRRFNTAADGRPGCGWIWLVHDGTGLAITWTQNHESPLARRHTPLLGVDVWEHAYYLRHQNRRADYLEAFWHVVSWDRVSDRYAKVAA